jgi:hypothetical protein
MGGVTGTARQDSITPLHERIHDQLLAGLVERDGELATVAGLFGGANRAGAQGNESQHVLAGVVRDSRVDRNADLKRGAGRTSRAFHSTSA